MSKRVADLLVETLQAAGVKTCYGIVGDTLNRIAHAIDRSEIDWVQRARSRRSDYRTGAMSQSLAIFRSCRFTARISAASGERAVTLAIPTPAGRD